MSPDETLHTVVTLLLGDGTLGLRETRFVRELAERLGLGPDAWAATVARVERGERKLIVPREPDQVQELLALLIDAAAVNGVVDEYEHRLLSKVAARVGVSEGDLGRLLASALDRVDPGATTRRTTAPGARNIAIIKAALAVLKSEGGVSDAEQTWLDALSARLGIDLWQLPAGNVALDDLMAGSHVQREAVFQTLVQAARADGVVGVLERGKLSAFASMLGIESAKVRALLGETVSGL